MPRKGVPYGGAICSLPSGVQSVNGQTGAVKLNAAHIPSDGSSNVQADLDAHRASIDSKAAKTEALGTGTALTLGGGNGARTLTLTRKTISGASSSSAINIPVASSTASGLMTPEQVSKIEALGTGTVTAANEISLPTNAPNFNVVSVTVPISGRAIVNIRGKFGNNGVGYRLVGYAKNATSAQTEWIFNTNSNSDNLYYSVPLIIDVNAGDVIHGCAYQTSGSTLDVSMGITMIIYPM